MISSHSLLLQLKKKPISKTELQIGIDLTEQKVGETDIKITDKSDPDNIKRELSFKSRINEMKKNNLLSIKMKPKTSENISLSEPIQSFSIQRQQKQPFEEMTPKQQTKQKMEALIEKRRKKNRNIIKIAK